MYKYRLHAGYFLHSPRNATRHFCGGAIATVVKHQDVSHLENPQYIFRRPAQCRLTVGKYDGAFYQV